MVSDSDSGITADRKERLRKIFKYADPRAILTDDDESSYDPLSKGTPKHRHLRNSYSADESTDLQPISRKRGH